MEHYKLTRYLYNMVEVKQSLLVALLNKNIDESLFWAFELFYSGFHFECIPYLNNIFEKIYQTNNENLKPFVEKMTTLWDEDMNETELALLLGSYVCTLCIRPYNLIPFVSECLKVKCDKLIIEPSPSNLIVQFQDKDVEPYKTIILDNPIKVLSQACRFALHKNMNELFEFILLQQDEILDILNVHWLYYAYKSPVWEKRMEEYGGVPNDEKKTIDFPNDDLYEKFTKKWYYEPDEQSSDIKNKLIGVAINQMNITEFCKLYNIKIKTKTRTKKKS